MPPGPRPHHVPILVLPARIHAAIMCIVVPSKCSTLLDIIGYRIPIARGSWSCLVSPQELSPIESLDPSPIRDGSERAQRPRVLKCYEKPALFCKRVSQEIPHQSYCHGFGKTKSHLRSLQIVSIILADEYKLYKTTDQARTLTCSNYIHGQRFEFDTK